MPLTKRAFKFEDFLFRLICAVCGAHVMVVFGVKTTFFEAILNPVYYKAMAGSLLIALPVVEYTGFVTRRLDSRYDWLEMPLQRLLFQFLLGIFATCTMAFLLASLYFYTRGINIFDTLYLRFDFPVVVILVVLMNVSFILQYYYRYARSHRMQGKTVASSSLPSQKIDNLIARAGNRTISVASGQVAFFYLEDDIRCLRTLDGRRLMVGESLEELEGKLNPADFFRANRQVIVSRKACEGYASIEFGKLQLICKPAFHAEIIVGQRKAKEFRGWLAGQTESVSA